jgi:MFS transporter, MHS family, proline/betaine transporter
MSRASIAVAAFSTVVEWYDFTLYLYFATVLSRVFFGAGGAALSTTLATFAIAYLLRRSAASSLATSGIGLGGAGRCCFPSRL